MSNRASSFVDSVAQSFCIHQYTNSTNAFVSNSVFPPRKTQVQIDICKTKFQLPPSYIRWDKFPLFISFLLIAFLAAYLQLSFSGGDSVEKVLV